MLNRKGFKDFSLLYPAPTNRKAKKTIKGLFTFQKELFMNWIYLNKIALFRITGVTNII